MPSHLNLDELVQDTRVHRRIYLEQEIIGLEMERIFERNWVFLGHESEVAQPGDYKTVRNETDPGYHDARRRRRYPRGDESMHASRGDHLPGASAATPARFDAGITAGPTTIRAS